MTLPGESSPTLQVLPGTDDATYTRYDVLGRTTWEIGAKGANGSRAAKRYTYRDSDDKVIATETGTVPDPTSNVLTALERVDAGYDSRRNKVRDAVSASGTIYGVTERAFDDRGQLVCEAHRMNVAAFSAVTDGCVLGAQGSYGPDRIVHNVYDAAGQLTQVQKGYQTSLQQNYATYGYSLNGKQLSVADANNNLAAMAYDGFDRQVRWTFPSPTAPGQTNPNDYEAYTYDVLGNRTSLRKRDNTTLTYSYDGMNRLTQKNVPASATGAAGYSVFYGYDVNGLQTYARFGSASGPGTSTAYDGFGRVTSTTTTMDGSARTLSYGYDALGDRIHLAASSGSVLDWTYDATGAMTGLYAGSQLVQVSYDASGRRQALTMTNGGASGVSYGYDAVNRLTSLGHDLAGTASDQSFTFGYNPASQIVSRSSGNDAYAYTGATNVSRGYNVNGLNQYTAVAGNSYTYDANGNLTFDGTSSYTYDAENRLVSRSTGVSLAYDPNGRLWQVSAPSGTSRFEYDGDRLIQEYDGAGTRTRLYGHGAGADEPLAWWENVGGAWQFRFLHADQQGSVIAATDGAGNMIGINGYDPWGVPNSRASPPSGGSAIPVRLGCRSSACTITKPASTPPCWAGSCRPTRSGTKIR
jgi:YD repeat-containing protein